MIKISKKPLNLPPDIIRANRDIDKHADGQKVGQGCPKKQLNSLKVDTKQRKKRKNNSILN